MLNCAVVFGEQVVRMFLLCLMPNYWFWNLQLLDDESTFNYNKFNLLKNLQSGPTLSLSWSNLMDICYVFCYLLFVEIDLLSVYFVASQDVQTNTACNPTHSSRCM